jgi:hypothetical protein
MSKKRMEHILDELSVYNAHLEGFTTKSEQLDSFEKAAKPTGYLPFIDQIRFDTRKPYNAICFCLNCQTSHRLRLQLEQRVNYDSRRSDVVTKYDNPEICFTLSFMIP